MVAHQRDDARNKRGRCWLWCGVVLLLLAACRAGGAGAVPLVGDAAVLPALRESTFRLLRLTEVAAIAELPAAGSCLVVTLDGWRVAEPQLSAAERNALRGYLERGGRIVAYGYAAALANELGLLAGRPRLQPFRWGYDARANPGKARLGLLPTSAAAEDLLPPAAAAAPLWLAGGWPCSVALCVWPQAEQSAVRARLQVELDGVLQPPGEAALVELRHGRGSLLACGIQPALRDGEELLRQNARQLLQCQVARGLPAGAPVYLLELPPAPSPAPAAAAALAAADKLPLAHAGYLLPYGPGASQALWRDQVLLPAWQAGSDLLVLQVDDGEQGLPLSWPADDPLPPVAGYRGMASGDWSPAGIAALSQEAQARGMLLGLCLQGSLPGERSSQRFGSLRRLVRELGCVRRLGAAAVANLWLRDWLPDPQGIGTALLEDYQPGARLALVGEVGPPASAAVRALHGEDGAIAGSTLRGLSDGFRAGFPPDLFPLGVLPVRAGEPPDWLALQANDFVRQRRGAGAALLWQLDSPDLLQGRTGDYLRGLLLEPLVAALAMPLGGTGQHGERAATAAALGLPPVALGAAATAPAITHSLQNNWLCLRGSGGALQWDPAGLARFDGSAALQLSPGLLRTRLYGGRPDARTFRSETWDLLQQGSRGAGGYGRQHRLQLPPADGALPPAQLAFASAPQWPAELQIQLAVAPGYHELRLQLRGIAASGILQLFLDDSLLHCQPFAAGHSSGELRLPLHLVHSGGSELRLCVGDGGALAIDQLQLQRCGDVAAAAEVVTPAGALAVVRERSVSSYHQETLELQTLADWPGLLLHSRIERAVQNLQLERTLQLPGYTTIVHGGAPGPLGYRQAFALRHEQPSRPDLVIVPLQLPRYDRLLPAPGGLLWRGPAEPGQEAWLGCWLVDRDSSKLAVEHGMQWLAGLVQPAEFDLGDGQEVLLLGDQPLPRLVLLRQRGATPYAVQQAGYWRLAGSQRLASGMDALRLPANSGSPLRIRGGPLLLAAARPGPGSGQLLQWAEHSATHYTLRLQQTSPLQAPAFLLPQEFDQVLLNGRPWAYHRERQVVLPAQPGVYELVVRSTGKATPTVAYCSARLTRCEFDRERGELLLVAAGDAARPAGLPYTAILRGPPPRGIDGGEIVDDGTLRYPQPLPAGSGTLIRFRPGVTKVSYGQEL